ncbi:MAG: hypothetical protein RQ982_05445, partial [Gammaproteobacteria bacterium]|nr:hypothetical protein [Gammaproteobacteria bacterium]
MAQITKQKMTELWQSSTFYGESAAWLESMYEIYLSHPEKLEGRWRQYFDELPVVDKSAINVAGKPATKKVNGHEISPREMHDYFIDYAQQKHVRGFEAQTSFDHEKKQVQVLQLINAYRFRGHQVANVNPLGDRRETRVDELDLEYHGLSESDFDTYFETGSLVSAASLPLREIYKLLQQTYCGTIGSEYMHIMETVQKRWIQQRLETSRGEAHLNEIEK